ncbi:hypothetical protein HAX54_000823 [Datura stramonium]|uniref:Uncharacterized protein n=1 Tax=Datura stramonium TaxID=4076 RepID=A0ABS8WQC5_DATST|nr:hypothetical protein [Datura stramonium]
MRRGNPNQEKDREILHYGQSREYCEDHLADLRTPRTPSCSPLMKDEQISETPDLDRKENWILWNSCKQLIRSRYYGREFRQKYALLCSNLIELSETRALLIPAVFLLQGPKDQENPGLRRIRKILGIDIQE